MLKNHGRSGLFSFALIQLSNRKISDYQTNARKICDFLEGLASTFINKQAAHRNIQVGFTFIDHGWIKLIEQSTMKLKIISEQKLNEKKKKLPIEYDYCCQR